MANYKKSFNFRNGVQVDDNNFIVNANGLVGIGTSIPTEVLDVRGNLVVSGITTTNELYVTGVSTLSGNVLVGTGVTIFSSLGIVSATSFRGDGTQLTGISGSKWKDDAIAGLTTTSDVGIGTTDPVDKFQVGENPVTGVGVGIDSRGQAYFSGITTAGAYSTSGFVKTGDLNVTGVSTLAGTLDVDGDTQVDDLNVAGVATFSKLIDANNRIDVVGGINGDQLYVAIATVTNTATFESAIVAESSLDVDGTTDLDVLNVAEDATFDGEVIVASNIKHKGDSDTYIEFTADKIRLIAGGKGLIDATEATTDSVTINDGGNDLDFRVEGIDDEYQIFSDGLTNKVGIGVSVPGAKLDVGGTLNVTGVSTFSALIDANARLDVVGGANIDQLNVTGVTTFGDDVTFTAGGLNVTGIITATELDIGTGGIDVDGQTDLDELVVAGIATFSTDVNITGLLTAGAIDGGTY